MRLEGRVALITGASRGIGAGIARCMAREGASIVVNYFRSREAADKVVKEVEGLGAKAIAVKADISDRQQVESMIEQSLDAFGKVDILVNNAGNEGPTTAMIDTTPEDFLETFHIHFMGAYYCIYSLLPHMRRYERGDIQIISSRQADYCPPNFVPYNVSKAAQDTLAKTLAKEERYNGIRVNSIAPGFVETDMSRDAIRSMTGLQDIREVDKRMPLGRVMHPEDIGNLCAFLASPEGSHISGEVMYVRGAVGPEPPSYYFSGPKQG